LRVVVGGVGSGGLWRGGAILPCGGFVRGLWVGLLLVRAVASWDGRGVPWCVVVWRVGGVRGCEVMLLFCNLSGEYQLLRFVKPSRCLDM
jgi:hypothetical protein